MSGVFAGVMSASLLLASVAWAGGQKPVTYRAEVQRVVDGDTVIVSIPGWPAPYSPVHVRLNGIDTPEGRMPPAKCIKEVRLAKIAKARLKSLLPPGAKVSVTWVGRPEKYGRLLATMTDQAGRDLISMMINDGIARPYAGGHKSDWCQ